MSALKSLWGNTLSLFGKTESTQVSEGHFQADRTPLVDVIFDERSKAEGELQKLWDRYTFERLKQQNSSQADAALQTFLVAFVEAFEDWQPDESSLSEPRQLRKGPQQESSPRAQAQASRAAEECVRGCRGGHPRAVLAGLASALEQLPQDIAQMGRADAGVAGVEGLSPPRSSVLEALVLAVRSHHNCTILLHLGMLASLSRILKVEISKFNAFAAILGPGNRQSSSSPAQAAQLEALQSQLAQATTLLQTFVSVEVQHCCNAASGLMSQYIRGQPLYCSTSPMEPGSRLEADAMDHALKPVLASGCLPLLLDILRLLSMLQARGATVAAKLEILILDCLLAVVSASSTAASELHGKDKEQSALLALIRGLGMPAATGNASATLSPPGTRPASKELHLQILSLQTIGAVIKRDRRNLLLFEEADGFKRLKALLLWTATMYPGEDSQEKPQTRWPGPPTWSAGAADSDPSPATERSSMVASTSGRGAGGTISRQSSFRDSSRGGRKKSVRFDDGGTGDSKAPTSSTAQGVSSAGMPWEEACSKVPESQALAEIFWVLESWLSLKQPRSAAHSEREHWNRLFRKLTSAVFDCFRHRAEGTAGLPAEISTLQHYVLAFLSHVLEAAPQILAALRELGYLDLLFGSAFFFWGQAQQQGPQPSKPPMEVLVSSVGQLAAKHPREKQQSVRHVSLELEVEELDGCVRASIQVEEDIHTADAGHLGIVIPRKPFIDVPALRAVRWRVVHLVEQAACISSADSNEPECSKLMQLLGDWVLEAEVVLVAAPAMGRILLARKELTLLTLERLDALGVLARGVKQQQQSHEAAQGILQSLDQQLASAAKQSPEAIAFTESRFALLHLLATLLYASPKMQRRAVRTWDTVAAVFGLLRDPTTRQVALRMVVGLMRMVPVSEDDTLAKTALFTKYVEILPTALENCNKEGLDMVFDLLGGVQDVVAVNPQQHQALFRKAECFVQIVNLLNLDYPPNLGSQLCCQVFATLTALLAGNEASRARVRDDVGYDTLYSILTRLVGPKGPSSALLFQMLGFILEKEYMEGVQGQTVANVHAVRLMFQCLRIAEQPVQEHLLRTWQVLVAGNMANLSACERADVNSILIDWLAAVTDTGLQEEIAHLLQLTAAYSITGRDLRAIFALLRPDAAGNVPSHSQLLLRSLAVMAQHEGPAAFFTFANDTAGLMRTSNMRFPGNKGYTFATWLRLDRLLFDPHTAGQSLFSFLANANGTQKGVSAALQGDKLLVYVVAQKASEAAMKFSFQAKRWYHVAITHSSGGRLTPSTVRLFINGEQQSSARFKFPKVTEPLNECSIGARLSSQETGLGRPMGAFSGQMGCIYLFEDILSPVQIAALCQLGPDYQSTFQPTESDPAFEQAASAASLVVVGREALAPVLLMSYNAQAAAGRMLYDTSDMDKGNEDGGTAAMLEGTQLCCTCQLRDILHCLGGIAVLLPLLAQLDAPTKVSSNGNASRVVDIVRLFSAVLDESPSNRQTMLQIQGVALMSQLLQQSEARHLTVDLLKAVEGLCRAARPAEELWQDVLGRLLLNLKLWSKADLNTQRYLLHFYVNLAKAEPVMFRKLLGVPRLLDAIRAHYWTSPSQDCIRPAAAGGNLDAAELRELRRGLLHVARILLRQSVQPGKWHAHGSWADVQAFIAFVGDCPDVGMLEDVLTALNNVLHHGSPTHLPLVACLQLHGGERLFMSLLQREQQSLRLLGLQLLSAFQGPAKRSSQAEHVSDAAGSGNATPGLDDMKKRGFWTSVSDLLLMFPLTQLTRVVLLEMLCVGTQPSQVRERSGGPAVPTISCAPVVGILLRLLLGCEGAHERLSTLEALHHLLVEGPKENRAAVVEQQGWEDWLLDLLLDSSPVMQAGNSSRHMSRNSSMASARLSSLLEVNKDELAASAPEQLQSVVESATTAAAESSIRNSGPEDGDFGAQILPGHDALLDEDAAAMRRLSLGSMRKGSMDSQASGNSFLAASDRGGPPGTWHWTTKEAQLIRGMLRALYGHCIRNVPRGFAPLEVTACRLREHEVRNVVDGWGLLHALMADIVKDLLGSTDQAPASAQADVWMMVSALATNPCKANAIGLLGLVDQMASGSLVQPGGQQPNPSPQAVQWAEQRSDADEVCQEIWTALGLSDSHDKHMTPRAWQVYDSSWQLMYVLHRALEGLASLQSPETPKSARKQGSLPLSSPKPASSLLGSMPFGIDRRLASLPVIGAATLGTRNNEDDSSAQELQDLSARLTTRLLIKYLRHASLANAESCANNALHLLPVLIDPARPSSRGHFHLLIAALVNTAISISGAGGHTKRERLICATLQKLVGAAKDVYAADSLQSPQLPPLEDPQFRLVAEGTLHVGKVTAAAQAEILTMHQIAKSNSQALELLEARNVTAMLHERQLRQNLQEDARQALGLIYTSQRSRRSTARLSSEEESQTLTRQWRDIQRSLCGAGGLWATGSAIEDLHWKLDKYEDPSRRRMKLKQNYKFQMYRQPSKGGLVPPEEAPPDPIALPGVRRRTQSDDDEDLGSDSASAPTSPGKLPPEAKDPNSAAVSSAEQPTDNRSPGVQLSLSEKSLSEEEASNSDTDRLSDDLQKVLFSTPCQLVSPKHVLPGMLRITPSQLHFSGELVACDSQQAPDASKGKQYKRWPLSALVEVHHARFLLRPFALEIFLADRSNALLSFPSAKVSKEVAKQLQSMSNRVTIFDRKRKQEMAQKLQQRWQRWETSNFDYLMQLNLLAGRTYNDLNQYPVFPWVIADYTSSALDLNAVSTFRDLSKPVGALDDKRLAFFKERFESLKSDPDTPPFHYGSHYSSAAVVLFYLIRLEPFTLLNRNLQGNRFDHADRLFHSIAETWQNSLHNSTDVKELTPEFFYQPEFLLNSNGFMLGQRQDGNHLDNVELPPWAHDSADEFVRMQREALESEYVSEHLHDWLDLIFGVKQQGRAAEEAMNLFYYLTYEGAVDLDEVTDPMQRKALEDQISFFGQTPSQLFKRRHPSRGAPPPPANHPLLNGPEAMKLAIVGKPPTRRPNIAVAEMAVSDGRVVLINADRAVSCHRWLSPRDQAAFTFSGIGEATYSVEADPSPPRLLGTPFAADLDCGKCYCVLPGGQVIVSCGYWDNSIRCYSVDDGRMLQSLRQHKDIVTCISLGSDGCSLVSGSRDTTVIIWDAVSSQRIVRGRGRAAPVPLPLRAQPRHILYGHSDAVVCTALSPELDLVVSASAEGSLLFHTLSTGRYVRMLQLPGKISPSLLMISPQLGLLVAYSLEDLGLHAYTVNGRRAVSAEGSERLTCMATSPDGKFLLTGGAKGLVTLRWLHSLQVVLRYDAGRGPVTALTVTAEECILAGTLDGSMLVFAPDPRRTISKRFDLADARPAGSSAVPQGPVATLKFES